MVAFLAMAPGDVTTAEGFREAILFFGDELDAISVEQAAALMDEIRGGAAVFERGLPSLPTRSGVGIEARA